MLCHRLPQNISSLKQWTFIITHTFCGSGIWEWLIWAVLVQGASWPGLWWPEGWLGLEDDLHSCRVGAGCWQEASVSHHVDLSPGFFEWPHDTQLNPSSWVTQKRAKCKLRCLWWHSLGGHTLSCLQYLSGTQMSPTWCGRGPHKIMNTVRRESSWRVASTHVETQQSSRVPVYFSAKLWTPSRVSQFEHLDSCNRKAKLDDKCNPYLGKGVWSIYFFYQISFIHLFSKY